MGKNSIKKRKNSSKGETPKSTRSTKEQKTEGNSNSSKSQLSPTGNIDSSNGYFSTLLNIDNNSVFEQNYNGFDQGPIMDGNTSFNGQQQYVHMQNMGQYVANVPNQGINGFTHVNMQRDNAPHSPMSGIPPQSMRSVTNADILNFMESKFEEMNKRLGKLENLEKKVTDIDSKLNKLWSDLDKRVTINSDKINSLEENVSSHYFDVDSAREELSNIREENQMLKSSICELQAKSMINNLIIGGIKETNITETEEQTLINVQKYMKDDLKIPDQELSGIEIESVRRFGVRRSNKPKNIIVCFKNFKTKQFVKSFKDNINTRESGLFMHDQFPPEVVAQRKKLIPIMKKAREDGKDAYIKYNKLIVNGTVYMNGPYGKIA